MSVDALWAADVRVTVEVTDRPEPAPRIPGPLPNTGANVVLLLVVALALLALGRLLLTRRKGTRT